MDRTGRSHDKNLIANVWSILGQDVSRQKRQFESFDDLKEALQLPCVALRNAQLSSTRLVIQF